MNQIKSQHDRVILIMNKREIYFYWQASESDRKLSQRTFLKSIKLCSHKSSSNSSLKMIQGTKYRGGSRLRVSTPMLCRSCDPSSDWAQVDTWSGEVVTTPTSARQTSAASGGNWLDMIQLIRGTYSVGCDTWSRIQAWTLLPSHSQWPCWHVKFQPFPHSVN